MARSGAADKADIGPLSLATRKPTFVQPRLRRSVGLALLQPGLAEFKMRGFTPSRRILNYDQYEYFGMGHSMLQ